MNQFGGMLAISVPKLYWFITNLDCGQNASKLVDKYLLGFVYGVLITLGQVKLTSIITGRRTYNLSADIL